MFNILHMRRQESSGSGSGEDPRDSNSRGPLQTTTDVLLHELKQPLQCILALTERLERSIEELDPATVKKQPIMKRDLNSMLVSIQQMRELLAAGVNFTGDHYCYSQWGKRLRGTYSALEALATLRNTELHIDFPYDECEDGPDIKVMHQVLSNLINNSMEAMDVDMDKSRDRKILVRTHRNDSEVVLQVHDAGQGVPENEREKIFERGHTTKAGTGGSGLGLWVCRKLAESRGGRLTVDQSKELGGACFVLTLPLRKEAQNSQKVVA